MSKAFIGAGSNLGNRLPNLYAARTCLGDTPGIEFRRSSPFYETLPVGGPADQPKYLNAVWEIETSLPPAELLNSLLSIEQKMGRERGEANAPRTLDLDLLVYDDIELKEEGLEIPHPRMHERVFVLKPFADLAPGWRHPALQRSARQLLEDVLEANSEA